MSLQCHGTTSFCMVVYEVAASCPVLRLVKGLGNKARLGMRLGMGRLFVAITPPLTPPLYSCPGYSPAHVLHYLLSPAGIQTLSLFRQETFSLVQQVQATTGLLLCPIREAHSILARLLATHSLYALHNLLV